MQEQPTAEHQWLHQMVGTWRSESECQMGPDQAPMKTAGSEVVRSMGGLWVVGDGITDGGDVTGTSLITLGYDTIKKKFVGTFAVSMFSYLWPYEGELDETKKTLTLDSIGPSFSGDGSFVKYQDIIEFIDENHRTLSSQVLQPDGSWVRFMTAHYYRVSA